MKYEYTIETKKGKYDYEGKTDDPMKILIGTPIDSKKKDFVIEKWFESVSRLKYPADLLIIDSSHGLDYVKKLDKYCKKYHFSPIHNFNLNKNWRLQDIHIPHGTKKICMIVHIEIDPRVSEDERLGYSREFARKQVLAGFYDAWLSWQCDCPLPPDGLNKLVELMEEGNYSVISHIPLLDEASLKPNHFFGIDLIKSEILQRYGFILDYPDMPSDTWLGYGLWLKRRVVRDGGKCLEIDIDNPEQFVQCRNKNLHLKLNLGCSENLLPGYINIDIQDPCDLKHDLRKPLPFKNNCVDEIYSDGNTISLFLPKEWYLLKKEMVRVLKPGGKLELLFWDLNFLFRAFLQNKDGQRWGRWIDLIFAGQVNEYEYAKNGFTYDKLVSDLKEEGMEKFSKKKTNMQGYIHLVSFKKI